MPKPQVYETRFDVPPAYACEWLTDFRPDDMKMVDPRRAPTIHVTRKGGLIVREWSMMGMDFHTETTLQSTNRWTTVSTVTRGGKPFARGGVVETVQQTTTGTLHRAEVTNEPLTFAAKLAAPLFNVVNKASVRKLFRESKARMEAQHRAGKPASE